MTDLDTAIVGAGPYGLSIAAHFRAQRLPFQLFGSPMESWRRYMPEGMILKSERFASNLWDPDRRFTLRRYCKEVNLPYQPVGDPLPLDLFLEYAEWFQRHAAVESRDVRIVSVSRNATGFSLKLDGGSILTSRRVILATGNLAFCQAPPQLSHLPEPLLLHSSRIGAVKDYAGRHVTVIGAGQSALETAALLHESGARVIILVQKSRVEWNPPSKPRPLFKRILSPDGGIAPGWSAFAVSELPRAFRLCFPPEKRHHFVANLYKSSGAWWLRDRVHNKVEVYLNSEVEAATAAGDGLYVVSQGPQRRMEFPTDHIIAGTGFKVDIDRLDYLAPSLRQSVVREAGGIPSLNSNFETSIPGLFIVGAASSPVFGPIMRFMYGAKHVGPILTRCLSTS
jgi:cation diffusion facilitator CzcD-associated flavoprotein CzcO